MKSCIKRVTALTVLYWQAVHGNYYQHENGISSEETGNAAASASDIGHREKTIVHSTLRDSLLQRESAMSTEDDSIGPSWYDAATMSGNDLSYPLPPRYSLWCIYIPFFWKTGGLYRVFINLIIALHEDISPAIHCTGLNILWRSGKVRFVLFYVASYFMK